jgi:hypothetical protein
MGEWVCHWNGAGWSKGGGWVDRKKGGVGTYLPLTGTGRSRALLGCVRGKNRKTQTLKQFILPRFAQSLLTY